LRAAAAAGGSQAVIVLLHDHKEHAELTEALIARLHTHTYPSDADTAAGASAIRLLALAVANALPEAANLRTTIRNSERLFPRHLAHADAAAVVAALTALSRDNARKQLSAALESKIRLVYFDRVTPPQVEEMIGAVLLSVQQLEDMRFLVAHAKAVFPEQPSDVSGPGIAASIARVRVHFRGLRAQGMQALHNAVAGHCADGSPAEVTALVSALGRHIRRPDHLRELASDISELCPLDITQAQPARIIRRFRQQETQPSASAR
jgi:hypothetical protein